MGWIFHRLGQFLAATCGSGCEHDVTECRQRRCAVYEALYSSLNWSGIRIAGEGVKAQGEPWLPLIDYFCSSYELYCCCYDADAMHRMGPSRAVNNKHIALEAWVGLFASETPCCFGNFYFSTVSVASTPACSPKESACRAAHILFLLCVELNVVLVIFCGFYSCCARHIAFAVPTFGKC